MSRIYTLGEAMERLATMPQPRRDHLIDNMKDDLARELDAIEERIRAKKALDKRL